jgi:PAS domain S-box-containing protein
MAYCAVLREWWPAGDRMRVRNDPESLIVRGLPLTLGTYVVLGGLVSAAAWPLDWPALADWDGDGIATQPNGGLSAILAGIGIVAIAAGGRRVAAACGLALAFIAGLTLVQHLSDIDVGIDTWLLFDRPWGRLGTRSPGRMGPPGAVCWLLVGAGLIAGSRHGRLRRLMPALGLTVATLAGLSMIGYLFGAGGLYAVPTVSVIALQTASFLMASGVGLVASARDLEPMRTLLADSGAGLLARRALPLALTLPIVIAFVVSLRQRAGYFDAAMAMALVVVLLVVLVCAAVWWGVVVVRRREQALSIATARLTKAHASLQRNEARMNAFLQQLPMGIGLIDADGDWVYANPMLGRFVRTDRPASDAGEIARWRVLDDGGNPMPHDQWPSHRALRGEPAPAVEALHTLDDGPEIWTRITAAPFRGADGAIGGAVAIVQDIDAQKRAAEALARAGRQLRLVTDHVPVHIAQCDRAGRYKFVNKAYAERFGLTPDEVVGRHLRDVLGEAAYASIHDRVMETLAGRAVEFELEIPYRTGAQFMHVAYAPERDDSGAVVGFVAAIVNITARKRAEDGLRDAVARKDHFLAMLAHELRNPLAPLVSALAVLHRSGSDPALLEQLRPTMERQVGLMVRLIDDLMDISRLSFNKLGLQLSTATLGSIVRDAVDASRPAVEAAGQHLEVRLPEAAVFVEVDPARLTQSIGNLLNNAVKFTGRGGRITIIAASDGGDVVVRVIDTGIGLSPETLATAFEMFTQADSSIERTRGGLGIGLGLARQLVEMHGGSLTALSAGTGQGSEFVIRLPGVVRDAPPTRIRRPAPSVEALRTVRRVLVVDDNLDAAHGLRMALELYGLEVVVAHDGRQALAEAAARPPDAVVLDIGLPGLNGYDVCRELRRQPWGAAAVILAMTGWGQQEDRRKSKDAGFDAHLVKPVEHDALIEALAAALRPSADPSQPDAAKRLP